MTWYDQKFTNMNVISAFVVAVFCGSMMTTVYMLLVQGHLYRHIHTAIEIHVHPSNFSYMSKLVDRLHKSVPEQQLSESQRKPLEIELKQRGKPKTNIKVSHIRKVKDASFQKDIDILKWKRPSFLKEYQNPCWKEASHAPTKCRNGPFNAIKFKEKLTTPILRCLPYFFMIGQPRSGLTNIYGRLIKHPDVVAPRAKDVFWIQRHRFKLRCSSVNTYLDFFQEVAQKIHKSQIINRKTNTSYSSKITGDASGDVMWDNSIWHELPGNEKCQEPCYTNADYVHHLNPSAKIIVALRNPIDRVYSDYLAQSVWLKYDPDNESFNKMIIEQIYYIEECLKKNHTIRFCIYNPEIHDANSQVRVGIGLYAVHLNDWYRVFPESQIHVIHFENFINDTQTEMEKLFTFLNLRELQDREMKKIMEAVYHNSRTKFAEESDMWEETKTILQTFYDPFNQQLANLLNNDDYQWNTG